MKKLLCRVGIHNYRKVKHFRYKLGDHWSSDYTYIVCTRCNKRKKV